MKNKSLLFGIWISLLVIIIIMLSINNFLNTKINKTIESNVSRIEYKNVKSFFDNVESFNEDLPRTGISESAIIKGKLIEIELQTLCVTAPCLPSKSFALQDIDYEEYKIRIYQVNPLVRQLEVGKTCILKGTLEKDIDFGRKIVYISNFKPEEIIAIS